MIELLILLLIKHFYIDFVNQSDIEVREKGIYLKKHGIYHSLKHGLVTIVILLGLTQIDAVTCYVIGLIESLIHYHIDWAKMKMNNFYSLTIDDRLYWNLLGLDQLLHQLTYIVIVYWVSL